MGPEGSATLGKVLSLLGGLITFAEVAVQATSEIPPKRFVVVVVYLAVGALMLAAGLWLLWRARRLPRSPDATGATPDPLVPPARRQLRDALRWLVAIGLVLATVISPFFFMYDNSAEGGFGGVVATVALLPITGLFGWLLSYVFFRLTAHPD